MFEFFPYTDSLPKTTIKAIYAVVCVGDIPYCNTTPLLGWLTKIQEARDLPTRSFNSDYVLKVRIIFIRWVNL